MFLSGLKSLKKAIKKIAGVVRFLGDEIEYNLRQRKSNIFIDIAGLKHKIILPVIRI